MKKPNKSQMQLYIAQRTNEMFNAQDWHHFTNILDAITQELVNIEYVPELNENIRRHIVFWKKHLTEQMSAKYVRNEQINMKQIVSSARYAFASQLMFSTLPGEPLTYEQMRNLERGLPINEMEGNAK